MSNRKVLVAFAGLFLLNLLLRVFYLKYQFVNGDETVRALTATALLDGERLYADIVTDKPPGATLFYAAVFAVFGRSMDALHMAAVLWNFATALLIYLLGSRIHGRQAGLWAALLFIYFGTNYFTQDMMAANTELLMALPYTASFYFFARARSFWRAPQHREFEIRFKVPVVDYFVAGVLCGIALLFKQVAVFGIAFVVLYELVAAGRRSGARPFGKMTAAVTGSLPRIAPAIAGFLLPSAVMVAWLAASDALAGFWQNVVVLPLIYAESMPAGRWFELLVGRAFGYVLFNSALWTLAIWAGVRALRTLRLRSGAGEDRAADIAILLWGIVSIGAVFMGGRFFGHYFVQALPALSLLGASGAVMLTDRLKNPPISGRAWIAAGTLSVLAIFGMVRFHQRTAILAYETIRGEPTSQSRSWGMTKREHEAEIVSGRLGQIIAQGEKLYIWGTALDIYWRSGCRPAARYLTPQYLTAEFTDSPPDLDRRYGPPFTVARLQLVEDLERNRPPVILDVSGSLFSEPYPEIVNFVSKTYIRAGQIGIDPNRPFVVLKLREREISAQPFETGTR